MRKSWWKILAILLMVYTFVAGLLMPLKPGLPEVSPINGQTGQSLELTIQGYNTHFSDAKEHRIWLKMEDYVLSAQKITPKSNNLLLATFQIPEYLPAEDKVGTFSLITDNEIDGASVLPSAVFIKQNRINSSLGKNNWPTAAPLENLHPATRLAIPYRNILEETIRNIYFHVSLWFSMFILLTIGVFYSIRYLNKGQLDDDNRAYALISAAVLYGLLGCATGSIWAKYTWGTWWTTDVKLNMSAIFMLIYLAYFVLRSSFEDEIKRARLSSVYNIFAFASIIPLLFVIPRLVDSLHPGNGGNPGLGGEDLDNTMRIVFYPAIIGMTLLGLWIATLRYRIERLKYQLLE